MKTDYKQSNVDRGDFRHGAGEDEYNTHRSSTKKTKKKRHIFIIELYQPLWRRSEVKWITYGTYTKLKDANNALKYLTSTKNLWMLSKGITVPYRLVNTKTEMVVAQGTLKERK